VKFETQIAISAKRVGKFSQMSPEPHTVWLCAGCGVAYLPAPAVDYESSEYRTFVDGGDSVEEFHRLHDAEQAEKLVILGTADLRATVLMDVAVCFSVVEHVSEPLALLQDIRRLPPPGSCLLLSTPKPRDIMLELLPDDYAAFFYRVVVHTWYFDADSIRNATSLAGFADASGSFAHRVDLWNAILWLRDRQPTGRGRLEISPAVFRGMPEANGRSDYLYCACVNA